MQVCGRQGAHLHTYMNEGIHLDLDTWIVPGQIRKANLCRGVGNRYTPAGTEVYPEYNKILKYPIKI